MVYDFVQKGLPLDGIIASSEPAALGTLYALKRAGLRVPQDVKIVSFDSTLYSLLTDPPLTSIERNPQSIAQKSCELILQMMRGEAPRRDRDLHPHQPGGARLHRRLISKSIFPRAGTAPCAVPARVLFYRLANSRRDRQNEQIPGPPHFPVFC